VSADKATFLPELVDDDILNSPAGSNCHRTAIHDPAALS
jgi:hypothetical protein